MMQPLTKLELAELQIVIEQYLAVQESLLSNYEYRTHNTICIEQVISLIARLGRKRVPR